MLSFNILLSLAALSFILHAWLLFTSFPHGQFRKTRYLFSHITLWLTGIIGYIITLLFAGQGYSAAIDAFDTPLKQAIFLIAALGISTVAHLVVKMLVLRSPVGKAR